MSDTTDNDTPSTIRPMAATDLLDSLDPYRLPTWARPTRYDVRLTPSLDEATQEVEHLRLDRDRLTAAAEHDAAEIELAVLE